MPKSSSLMILQRTATSSLMALLISGSSSWAFGPDEYVAYEGKQPVPAPNIRLCADDFDGYRSRILAFAKHHKIEAVQVYDARSAPSHLDATNSTLAFLGDPSDPRSRPCLEKHPDLATLVQMAAEQITSGERLKDFSERLRASVINPYVGCNSSSQRNGMIKTLSYGICVGGMRLDDYLVATLFSYKLR